MDANKKEACLEKKRLNMKRKYHTIDSPQKAKKRETYHKIKSTKHDLDYFIQLIQLGLTSTIVKCA